MTDQLTTREVDRNDVEARVRHYDNVCRAGCEHEAVIWNGSVVLVSCPVCAASAEQDFTA
jgi:hypothetical protein